MNRQIISMWIAGLMVGTGSGLIIARSVPEAENAKTSAVTISKRHGAEIETGKHFEANRHLSDPHQYPDLKFSMDQPATEQISPLQTNQSEPQTTPRLFPEGKALPVQPPKTQGKEQVSSSQNFRKDLEEIAPEFSEKALNDLEKIRTIIESEDQVTTKESDK